MPLTRVERERVQDGKLKIQSAANTLNHVDPQKIADFEEIRDCLEEAGRSLEAALKSAG